MCNSVYSIMAKHLKMKMKFFYQKKKQYNFNNLSVPFHFGDLAFMTTTYLIFNLKRSLRFTLFIKRMIKRRFRGVRKFWILPGDYFRVSFKTKGARMGKGKGKSANILRRISPYLHFVEFKNVRLGRVLFFKNILNSRFPRPLLINIKFNFFLYPGRTLIK
uniref:Ribosomal protein L16 n=1 Tax=Euplotes vanleeuwenhoeki TaxID=2794224 RepID=A0A7T1C4Z0_9SPIT|nr:hypothetical protein KQ443_mgp27 [Euplotes vanleeuwenhoeki]QPM99251.1 hypothetical protein MitoLV_23 [Euplotes vanleeuwenhoeki]